MQQLLLLELRVLTLLLHHAKLVGSFTLRRAFVDMLLPCEGGHMLDDSKVRDGSSGARGRGRGRGSVLICCDIDEVGNNIYVGREFGQDEKGLDLL